MSEAGQLSLMKNKQRNRLRPISNFVLLVGFVFCSGCGILATRPDNHLAYAEAAFQAAQKDGADTAEPQTFQLARETLARARSAYRLKNFRDARRLAIRARILSEEAEFKTKHRDAKNSENPSSHVDATEKL